MNLELECKNIDVESNSRGLLIELTDVDVDFIECLKAEDIIQYSNVNDLLNAMDSDDIMDFLESKYDIEIKERR